MEWQLCPLCKGVGMVSGGYFNRAGDCDAWSACNTLEECRICEGKGIIAKPDVMSGNLRG